MGQGWVRAFRLALKSLPSGLRLKHEREMQALFLRDLERARRSGRRKVARMSLAAIWDVVRRGLYERLRPLGRGASGDGGPVLSREWGSGSLRQELAQSVRALVNAPRFTIAIVLMLGLGIGANTAVFSVVDAVLLEPLPFPEARRVTNLAWDGGGYLSPYLTATRLRYWQEHSRSFDAIATWQPFSHTVGRAGEFEEITGLRVSGGFLELLGYSPILGRGFSPSEEAPGGPNVAVISYWAWQAYFGGALDVLGEALLLDATPYTIVGVLPRSFAFPYEESRISLLAPLRLVADPEDHAEDWPAIAVLREGVTRSRARAEVAALTGPFRAAFPDQVYKGERGMVVASFGDLYVRDAARALWILMGAVALILLITCANAASLFLARATEKRREFALRAALGASRVRIVRLVLTESVLVTVLGAAAGLGLAKWGVAALLSLTPSNLPRMGAVAMDGRVLGFAFVVALATALMFGGVAARPAAQRDVRVSIDEGGRGSAARARAREGLLVVQTALSAVLLAGAGLLLTTWFNLGRTDLGFDARELVVARIGPLPSGTRTVDELWQLEAIIGERLGRSPGVAGFAAVSSLPLERGRNVLISIGGRPDAYGSVEWRAIGRGYFATLGVRLVSGRGVAGGDVQGARPVAVINESFARRFFPESDPIGRRIDVGWLDGELRLPAEMASRPEIVGVVADIRDTSLRNEPRPTMYVPYRQALASLQAQAIAPVFVARGHSGDSNIGRALTDSLRSALPEPSQPEVLPFARVVADAAARERFGAMLLTVLGALALVLTTLGAYAVLDHRVRLRRREIGIRVALGASRRNVTRMILRQGLGPVLVGLLLGIALAGALSRVVAAYLWGVDPASPTVLGAAGVILLLASLVACWLPTREAFRVDAAETLRSE